MQRLQINSTEFLANYWQKQPAIFRQAFKNAEDIIDEHELAGLAQEEHLDSRIIRMENDKWHHDTGPFDDFEPHCKGNWSLLVQGIENLVPEAQHLLDEFNFIPGWRVDDLMMSFSVEGAGVGPHVDQYDVFIIQGKGRRRWQIGLPADFQTITPHPKIRQINEFTPIIDEVLAPGDMIYIPPGHPHNGIALENCINYSVGFRANTQTELLSHFCDYLIDNDINGRRYADPDLLVRQSPSELKTDEIEKFRTQLHDLIDSQHFQNWLGCHLTTNEKLIPEPPEIPVDCEEVAQLVNSGHIFEKTPGLRTLHYEVISDDDDGKLSIFIDGDRYFFPPEEQQVVKELLNQSIWQNITKKNFINCSHFIHTLTTLINKGFWTI